MHPEMGGFNILTFVVRQAEQDVCLYRPRTVLFTFCSLPHDVLPCSEQLMFTPDGHDRLFFKKKENDV